MRILKTTQTYYPYVDRGGPPAKIRSMAETLARRGHEVTVLTADLGEGPDIRMTSSPAREKTPWGWEFRKAGVEALYLRTLANYRATTLNLPITRFCAKRLSDYDVVHVYGQYDLIGPIVSRFCRRRRIPYVLEPMGMSRPKLRSIQKKRLYTWLIGNAMFEGAEVIVATSETERGELRKFGIRGDKIVVRRNGIELNSFESLPARGSFRRKLFVTDEEPVILFLGRISFIKGLDLLLHAFSEIAPQARLIIAGPDDGDGCLERLNALVAKYRMDQRVIINGPLYGNDKIEALVDADILVLPSRHESFGNVAAEAIACGTPVLLSDRCGIAPLISTRAGMVVSCEVESLRQGMRQLLNDKVLLRRLGEGCKSVAQNLSWEEPIDFMERVYASMVRH